jgi:hypothetical protein
MNCARYADLDEYSPDSVSLHVILSSVPCRRTAACTMDHSSTNCCRWTTVICVLCPRALSKCFLQCPIFLPRDVKNSRGNILRMPALNRCMPEGSLCPSPIDIVVDAANKRWSVSEQGFPKPTQGFSGHSHSCQSQRSRRLLQISLNLEPQGHQDPLVVQPWSN